MIILDGGMGRELARNGAPFAQPEWSALALIEAPQFVALAHAAFISAGAQVITTNSYAVVPFHIGEARFADLGHSLAALAGRLARDAAEKAGHSVTVVGSLPPVCGSYRADLFDAANARPVLKTLIDALSPFVDHWLAETLSSTAEADLVADILGEDARPLWLSFTLDDEHGAAGGVRLRSGQTVAEAVAVGIRLRAKALLFNCSQPEVMAEAVGLAGQALGGASIRLGVYANAFPPQGAEAEANATLHPIRADLTPQGYLAFAQAWRDAGASIIGGCCGIGPEHIAALAQAVTQDRL